MKTAPKYSLRRRFLVIFCPAFSCAFEMAAHKWRTNLRLSPDKTKHAATRKFPETACFFYGRGDKIRTCGPYVPNVVLYQTEPHLDATHIVYHDFWNLSSVFCKTKFSKVSRSYFAENIVKKTLISQFWPIFF